MTKKFEFAMQEVLSKITPTPIKDNGLTAEQKIAIISKNFQEILTTLGMDLSNDSLRESPQRIAKMYVNEIFKGLDPRNFPKIDRKSVV